MTRLSNSFWITPLIFLICCGVMCAQTATPSPVSAPSILLWPNGAPGALGTAPADQPAITEYLPTQNPTHTAVVVCPGGAYAMLATNWEGTTVAQWLNAHGVAAFVLRYRLGPRYHYPTQLMDAQRAIRYVRSHADQFNVNPDHIGIWGFSAGGHLAATAGTHFNGGDDAADPIERVSSRPDFMVLAYPLISMMPGTTHITSMHMLLGEEPDPILQRETSNELQVTTQTPPAFLFSTTADKTVSPMNTVLFYQALLRAGVPVEMHIFEQGAHGSGLGENNPELRLWPVLLQNWMHMHGWMEAGSQ